MRDLERERAAHALARVTDLADRPKGFKQRYHSYVDRFGGAVVMNGLGQALATELAAGGDGAEAEGGTGREEKQAHQALAASVAGWLSRPGGVYPDASDAKGVMAELTTSDQQHYLRAQVEVLAWLTWHKKFSHASLPSGGAE